MFEAKPREMTPNIGMNLTSFLINTPSEFRLDYEHDDYIS